MKIVVLSGGISSERNVSLNSGKNVVNALKNLGHEVVEMDIKKNFLEMLQKNKPDVVFNALHGKYGEDGCIPGLLEILKIPYTHSGVRASAISMHKPTTKKIFDSLGIPTPNGKVIKKKELSVEKFSKPYVLKPVSEGSSLNIQIINPGSNDFKKNTIQDDEDVLLEEFVSGKDLSVAVLNGTSLGIIEVTHEGDFFDYDSKYNAKNTKYTMPANVSSDIYDKAMDISQILFNKLGCRGLIRVDFIYDDENKILCALEINTHPGLTSTSLASKIAEYAGIPFEGLIQNIVDHAKLDD